VSWGWRSIVWVATLPRKTYNKVLNVLVSVSLGHRVIVDWTDARIINQERIKLHGRFQAGRGLWLQAIGEHGRIDIGDGARLSDYVHIGAIGHLRIGCNVLVGSKVLIIDHSHGHGYRTVPEEVLVPPGARQLVSRGDISIGDNVWLAENVIVLSGVTIGDNCVVGAHSLVRGNLPANSVCAGNPARVLSTHSSPSSETLRDN
jgi:acetyltransferase-like isoleucine patch superfamily enzyme